MKQSWNIEVVPGLQGFCVEWFGPDSVLLSRKNRIYRSKTPTGDRELVGEASAPVWRRFLSNVRLAQRLLRFMVYNVLPLADSSIFVSFGKQCGIVDGGRYQPIGGIQPACRILRGGCALASDGAVYWGEYLSNPQRGPVRIYRYAPGAKEAEVVHTFPAGEIRHVHGIYRDPHSDSLWCVTGDSPPECRILRSTDGFDTLDAVGSGDETWRTVSLLFAADAVYYASDAEFRPNHIYRLDRRSAERKALGAVDGPVYYSHAVDADLFFGVTAELCPSQKDACGTLWHLSQSGSVRRVVSFPKDLMQNRAAAKYFMPGTFCFPRGPGVENETFIHGIGLCGIDNVTLRLARVMVE